MILYGAEIEYVHVQKNLKGGFNEKFLKQCTKLDPSKRRCNTFSLNAYLLTSYDHIVSRVCAVQPSYPASIRSAFSIFRRQESLPTNDARYPPSPHNKANLHHSFPMSTICANYLISTQKRLLEAASVEMNDLIVLSVPILNFV